MYEVNGSDKLAVTNCTFTGNSAYRGGGMYNSSSTPSVVNCIFWGNDAYMWNTNEIFGTALVSYSCVQGGHTGTDNISDDPSFVDADGADDIYGTEDDDLHILPASPCYNTGDPASDYTGQVDMDGDPRDLFGRVDIGADEYRLFDNVDIVYVDQDATSGADNGTNWDYAFLSLQDALDVATGGPNQIWVAAGTYTPGTLRMDSFQMINGVAIYGGFSRWQNGITGQARSFRMKETLAGGTKCSVNNGVA